VQQPGIDPVASPDSRQDGAGDQVTDRRVRDLMGLANRRLTMAQKAEAERDAARAELDALRASMDDGWQAQRAEYWQQQPPATEIAQAEAGDDGQDGADEVDDPNYDPDTDFSRVTQPQTRNDPNAAPRSAATPIGPRGSELDAARAAFKVASEAESERLKHLLDWP
jgi:hypothetical protein